MVLYLDGQDDTAPITDPDPLDIVGTFDVTGAGLVLRRI